MDSTKLPRFVLVKRILVSTFILACLGAAAFWLTTPTSVRVEDVRKEELIILKRRSKSGHVHGIEIRGSGRIHGKARITLMLGDQPYRVEEVQGDVNFRWGGDWYSDTAEIRYEPVDVESGYLIVRYSFSAL